MKSCCFFLSFHLNFKSYVNGKLLSVGDLLILNSLNCGVSVFVFFVLKWGPYWYITLDFFVHENKENRMFSPFNLVDLGFSSQKRPFTRLFFALCFVFCSETFMIITQREEYITETHRKIWLNKEIKQKSFTGSASCHLCSPLKSTARQSLYFTSYKLAPWLWKRW